MSRRSGRSSGGAIASGAVASGAAVRRRASGAVAEGRPAWRERAGRLGSPTAAPPRPLRPTAAPPAAAAAAARARPGDGVSTRAVVSSAPRTDVVTPRQSVDLAAAFGARIGLSSSESDESSLPSWTWTCTLCVPLPLATAALMSPRVVVSSIVRSGSGARGACGSSRATIRWIECLAGRSRGRPPRRLRPIRACPGMSRGRRRRRRGARTRASRSRVPRRSSSFRFRCPSSPRPHRGSYTGADLADLGGDDWGASARRTTAARESGREP